MYFKAKKIYNMYKNVSLNSIAKYSNNQLTNKKKKRKTKSRDIQNKC